MNHALHLERARRLWPFIVQIAKTSSGTWTYGDLGRQISPPIHPRVVGHALSKIQDWCATVPAPKENPKNAKLQSLVVRKGSGLAGGGYKGSNKAAAFYQEQAAARNVNWPSNCPF